MLAVLQMKQNRHNQTMQQTESETTTQTVTTTENKERVVVKHKQKKKSKKKHKKSKQHNIKKNVKKKEGKDYSDAEKNNPEKRLCINSETYQSEKVKHKTCQGKAKKIQNTNSERSNQKDCPK